MSHPHALERPQHGSGCYFAPNSTVVGDVRMGDEVTVWPGACVRGDEMTITIGDRTSVQDGVVIHADPGYPARIGSDVTIGHGAIVHGCVIEDACVIGMNAVILNGARVRSGTVIAAGAVVKERFECPPGSLLAGVPAKVVRAGNDAQKEMILFGASEYVKLGKLYNSGRVPVGVGDGGDTLRFVSSKL